ncbi:MAG: GNAT family N-acetyltransferase [Alphaproteobacteria bacterium]|nr:GNAT family N-acetyltransferase [Alphaproteobacteria bacterium]
MTRIVNIRPGDPRDPAATTLLQASHDLMCALFPDESNHFLSIDALTGEDTCFFIAELDAKPAGCAALLLKDGYGELKSMFVDPGARGAKIGAKLLDRIENEARTRNLPTLRLETGDELKAAQRLYLSHGFKLRAPFGDYNDDPRSLYMEKPL